MRVDELTSFDVAEEGGNSVGGNIEQLHYLSVKVEQMKRKLLTNIENKNTNAEREEDELASKSLNNVNVIIIHDSHQ